MLPPCANLKPVLLRLRFAMFMMIGNADSVPTRMSTLCEKANGLRLD